MSAADPLPPITAAWIYDRVDEGATDQEIAADINRKYGADMVNEIDVAKWIRDELLTAIAAHPSNASLRGERHHEPERGTSAGRQSPRRRRRGDRPGGRR